jgi:hypothetical protein
VIGLIHRIAFWLRWLASLAERWKNAVNLSIKRSPSHGFFANSIVQVGSARFTGSIRERANLELIVCHDR